jgi:hypothetical protein
VGLVEAKSCKSCFLQLENLKPCMLNAMRLSLTYCDMRCALKGILMAINYIILPVHRSQHDDTLAALIPSPVSLKEQLKPSNNCWQFRSIP